jgi:hypothetical protein
MTTAQKDTSSVLRDLTDQDDGVVARVEYANIGRNIPRTGAER